MYVEPQHFTLLQGTEAARPSAIRSNDHLLGGFPPPFRFSPRRFRRQDCVPFRSQAVRDANTARNPLQNMDLQTHSLQHKPVVSDNCNWQKDCLFCLSSANTAPAAISNQKIKPGGIPCRS